MINKVLLISEQTLKKYTLINDNVDGMYILPAIQSAQDIDLDTIIGPVLNNKLQQLVKNSDIVQPKYEKYKVLLDEYVTPYLCWQVMTNIQIAVNFKLSNSGVVENYDERKNRLDYTHSKALSDQYQKYANAYATKLKNYLCANSNQYPEYHQTLNREGEESPRLCSIYLEDDDCCDYKYK